MKCARCLEDITAPYWFEGKPFGYTCIKIVNPTFKRKQKKEDWIAAVSHNFNPELDTQQAVTAYIVGKRKTSFIVFKDRQHNRHVTMNGYIELGVDNIIYINIMALKNYVLIKEEIENQKQLTA